MDKPAIHRILDLMVGILFFILGTCAIGKDMWTWIGAARNQDPNLRIITTFPMGTAIGVPFFWFGCHLVFRTSGLLLAHRQIARCRASRKTAKTPGKLRLIKTDPPPTRRYMSSILIVDDEPAICWAFSEALSDDGHSVRVVPSAEEALQLTDGGWQSDVVVMDVRLPGIDGLSAMRELRERIGTTPVVVITAFGSPAAVRASSKRVLSTT